MRRPSEKSLTRSPEAPVICLLLLGSALFAFSAPIMANVLLWSAAVGWFGLRSGSFTARQKRLISALMAILLVGIALMLFPWASQLMLTLSLGVFAWLKLAESDRVSDRIFTAIAALFLISTNLLLMPANASLMIVFLTTGCFIWVLCAEQTVAMRPSFVRVAAPLALTCAVSALLFIFTPRITGNLGMLAFALDLPFVIETPAEAAREVPEENSMSLDGLNQSSDGDIRVLTAKFYKGSGNFEKGVPPLGDLYWRGQVLWTYKGGYWSGRPGWETRSARMRSKLNRAKLERQLISKGNRALYDVSVFPHGGELLYAMDLPAYAPASTYVTEDWQLMNLNPVREVMHMPMMAYVEYRAGTLDEESRAMALQLPAEEEPRIQQMGRDLRQEFGKDNRAIALKGLDVFAKDFRYDRNTPPSAGENPLDQFLFESKLGFGLQFASSYAVMMRAAGIPTRVVSGYRGGTRLGLVERVLVLQQDAHAWTEIWMEGYGWVRMDPAARTVASQRKQGIDGWGLASGLGEDEEEESDNPLPSEETSGPTKALTTSIEHVSKQHWLEAFDADTQGDMLQASGFEPNWRSLVLIGGIMLVLLVGGVIFARVLMRWLGQRQQPITVRIADQFCRYLAQHGEIRHPQEGMRSFAQRALQNAAWTDEERRTLTQCLGWVCELSYGQRFRSAPSALMRMPKMSQLILALSDENTRKKIDL